MSFKAPYKWIFKRDNKRHRFHLMDRVGNDYDLTNVVEITLTVREGDTESSAVIFSCTMTGGDIVRESPYTGGLINVDVIPADTASTEAGSKVYDIEVEDENNQDHTFGKGEYEIIQDITHE